MADDEMVNVRDCVQIVRCTGHCLGRGCHRPGAGIKIYVLVGVKKRGQFIFQLYIDSLAKEYGVFIVGNIFIPVDLIGTAPG